MSFLDYYPIITLPRVVDVDIDSKVVVPALTPNEQYIDVAISKSNISSYTIKPTPRLIWSHPISPSSVVECMDVQNHQQYIVSITDRKVNKLLCLDKNGEIAKELRSPNVIKHLKYIDNRILVVFQDGEFEILNDLDQDFTTTKTSLDSEVVYVNVSEFILLIIRQNSQFIYKVLNLQGKLVNEFQEPFSASIFQYCGGCIYKYTNQTFYKMNLTFKIVKTWNIGIDIESMVIANEDRIIISCDNNLQLVNMKYETLLDTLDIQDTNHLVTIAETNGVNTMGLFLKLNTKKNKLTLNLVNVNVGYNNLVSNLGKAFMKSEDNTYYELDDLESVDLNYKPTNSNLVKKLQKLSTEKLQIEALKYFKNNSKLTYQAYEDTDKTVDINMIRAIHDLIEDVSKYPYLYHYIVSHPLFPPEKTVGLLKKLESHSKILKQCILTCPNLPIDELLQVLLHNVSKDLVNRICRHNLIDIIPNFQTLMNSQVVDVSKLVLALIELDTENSWQLIKLVVDVNGSFNLSEDLIEQLITLINDKLKVLDLNNTNLLLLNSRAAVKSDVLPNYSIEKLTFT